MMILSFVTNIFIRPKMSRMCLFFVVQDPNQMSSKRLMQEQILGRVKDISKAGMLEEWHFRKAPYSQGNPVLAVSH